MEPDYKELIPPMQLRRMTKPVRTGVAAAKLALEGAGHALPDAIQVGTAYGMLQDSEQFLRKMIEQEEQMLNPTAFIQSTHNTVAGQIALGIGCNAHNMTFVHKGHSFESAVMDAALMLEDHPGYQVLAGAVDECTDTSFAVLRRFGVYDDRTTAGEGAAFFCLSGRKRPNSRARIVAFDMFIAGSEPEVAQKWSAFLERFALSLLPTEPVVTAVPLPFAEPQQQFFYKEYCGSYPTDSAFGLACAASLAEQGHDGRCWLLAGFGRYYSIWLLEKA